LIAFSLSGRGGLLSQSVEVAPEVKAALAGISADSLRGHLSFIASDLLEGRNTPSAGLDIAAHYIAAQFRRAGLAPVGDDGYFQAANWILAERSMEGFELTLESGRQRAIKAGKDRVTLSLDGELALKSAPVLKVDYNDAGFLAGLTSSQVRGRVVITEIPDPRRQERPRRPEMFRAQMEFMNKMVALGAALIVSVDRVEGTGGGGGPARLINPESRASSSRPPSPPLVTVHDAAFIGAYDLMKPGLTRAKMSVKVDAAREKPITLRNVIGLLPGSDPVLKDSYVLVTAHYDHVGVQATGEGDRIFNGANDDGSGTVSVIELASALARLEPHPKRSIVFMTYFGEEKGALGSRYYARHPVVPIEKTIANINLEQVGRTDSSEGPQLANATLTGFDYSSVSEVFRLAGQATGISVYKHERNSDVYFGRSDNQALADVGIPAHTICTAFAYPDYHGAGDHWEKIDYANMEKVNRMIALGLVMLANSADEPRWNEANPKTARYVKAWRERRGK
jgi:hypothetical protein